MKKKIAFVGPWIEGERQRIFESLESCGYLVSNFGIGSSKKRDAFFYVSKKASQLRHFDVIVSVDYNISFFISLLVCRTGCSPLHIASGFNQSSRLFRTGISILDGFSNRIINRASWFVINSRAEAAIFNDLHDIPNTKFVFCHWGYDLPCKPSSRFENHDKPYFCIIGRNNRDFDTFCKAFENFPANGVIIAPDYLRLGNMPDNVQVFRNMSAEDCLSCILNAEANVMLLEDANRGAGHITLVSAMLLGKAQIVSDIPTVKDYFISGTHGWGIPLKNVKAVQTAMITVLENAATAIDYGLTAKNYAQRWLSHEVVFDRYFEVLLDCIEDRIPSFADSEWEAWISGYISDYKKQSGND